MVSGIIFVTGYMWAAIQCQVLNTYRNSFIDDSDLTVLDVSNIRKASFPLTFAGTHDHPVLTRLKQMSNGNHVLSHGNLNKRDNMFGNFDPNKFNSQAGQSYNPNAVNGVSGSTSTGGMSMFNPNAMNGGSGTGSSSTGTSMFNPNAMMGGGSASGTGSMFNPNAMMGGASSGTQQSGSQSQSGGSSQSAGSSQSGGASMFGGSSSGSTGSGSSSSGSMPHYNPNNVINTGAKYDPNAANSGMGAASSGGSSPSFTNGMGMKAQQQLSSSAANWTGSASGSGAGSSGSAGSGTGSQGSGSSGSGPFDPNKVGSGSAGGSSQGSGSSASSSFGSASGGSSASSSFGSSSGTGGSSASSFGSSSGSSGGGSKSQSGSQTQSQTGSGSSSTGAVQSGGSSSGSTGTFDPIKTNSMATSGFNPLNPMLGKDINQLMGPQSQTGSKGPGNFDPGAVNTQMGSQGMSLNMFGGAGGKTDPSKKDASSLMGGAQGMMAGSSAVLGGGNAMMGGQTGGSGSGSTQTGGSGSGFGQTGGSSGSGSSGFNFNPNQMMGGGNSSGTGSGSSSSSSGGMSMFNPSAMMGGGSSGGSGSSSGSSSGGMSMFNPNAMMGGGSVNPMSPGGNMNPMNPGSSMTGSGSSSGTRNSGNTVLDPMGAMSGTARNFSGGANLIDPMGFMNGGGLTGAMTNMFNPSGRSVPVVGTDRLRRETPQLNWRHGNFINTATGQAYNPMDPMGFIFQGNKEQFTKGNGVDTPTYNPDEYSYTYAGVNFQPFPVIPSSSGAFNPSYQNFDPTIINNPTADAFHDTGNASTAAGKQETIQPGQSPLTSHFNPGMMSDLYQNVINSTNMYSHAVYSGTPGMLGTGSQSQIMPQVVGAPMFTGQYINPSFENLTETEQPGASYSGLPGMEGVGSQVQGSISTLDIAQLPQISVLKQTDYGQKMNYTTSNSPGPIYNGIPGMLGTGAIAGVSTNTASMRISGGLDVNTTVGGSNIGSQGMMQPVAIAASGLSSYGMGVVQQTEVNNWNGDWPGKTSNGTGSSSKDQTWSGDWSENWPTTSQQDKDNSTSSERKSDQSVNNFGSFGQSASQAVSWDGSWPGQSSKADSKNSPKITEQTGGHSNRQEILDNTLTALKALISQLNSLSNNTDPSGTQEASHSMSFSDLAAGWKDDIRNN